MYYHLTKLLLLVDHITIKAANTIVLTALIYKFTILIILFFQYY